MPELSCPQCGRLGNVPRTKLESRLVCKKCHAVFHMNKAGRVVLGEPHDESRSATRTAVRATKPAEKKSGTWRDYLPEGEITPRMKAAALGAAALCAGFIVWLLLPVATLEQRAKDVAEAFKKGERSTLKSMALKSPNTSREVENWYNVVHPRLEKRMKEWGVNDVRVEVMPDMDNTKEGEKVTVMLMPAVAGSLTSDSFQKSITLMFYLKKRSGQWWINGKATVNAAAGTALPNRL
jgi:hypothetical protein